VRSIHLKLLREVFSALGSATLKAELRQLNDALRQPGIKLGVRKAYNDTFARLRDVLSHARGLNSEIQTMLTTSFRQLNAEYGFSLQTPREPELVRYERDLDLVERSHLQYLGLGNVLRLAQPEFADRLVRALATRLRVVYESALGEVELWNKTAAAQLDAQLRERRKTFARRIEAIDRIQDAANTLDERITEINSQDHQLTVLDGKLQELTSHLVDTPTRMPDKPATPAKATVMPKAAPPVPVPVRDGARAEAALAPAPTAPLAPSASKTVAKPAAAVPSESGWPETQIQARAA
jgi:hypothetical protein